MAYVRGYPPECVTAPVAASVRYISEPTAGEVSAPVVRPVWGPAVHALKQKVKDLEETENRLLDEFKEREAQFSAALDRLEATYTEEMEQIRENDLKEKEALHRRNLRMRRQRLEDLRAHREDQQRAVLSRTLDRRELEYRRQREQEGARLTQRYEEEVRALQEQIRVAQEGGGESGFNELGLNVITNLTS
eukprot:RCo006091